MGWRKLKGVGILVFSTHAVHQANVTSGTLPCYDFGFFSRTSWGVIYMYTYSHSKEEQFLAGVLQTGVSFSVKR
jgi:hypothetical protein